MIIDCLIASFGKYISLMIVWLELHSLFEIVELFIKWCIKTAELCLLIIRTKWRRRAIIIINDKIQTNDDDGGVY